MRIEFDEAKDEVNLAKHGVSLALGAVVLENPIGEAEGDRRTYGEVRMNAFGLVGDRLFASTYTWRGEVRRVISMRRANKREQRKWLS